jgi:hypothetical protein
MDEAADVFPLLCTLSCPTVRLAQTLMLSDVNASLDFMSLHLKVTIPRITGFCPSEPVYA